MNQTASTTAANAQEYTYSLDDETYKHGTFATRQAAITDAIETYEPVLGTKIFVGRSSLATMSELVSADDVIQGLMCRADDIAGEYADTFPDLSVEDKNQLERMLIEFLIPRCPITFGKVSDVQEHAITLADLDMASEAIKQRNSNEHIAN
ncbi:MAG: hypothetical protein ACEQSN_15010 [Yersinia sp. (in: enterobacteria)]